MEDRHTARDGRKHLSNPQLDCEKYGGRVSSGEDRKLWPRPLAQKWTVMLFLGTCLLFCSRMAMPICSVSMAASFHWSKIDSGLVLGGFFWGYCFTQILGGHASDKVGGEHVLFVSAASWSLITAMTPLLAHLGSHTLALMTLARFLMGLTQGVFFPALMVGGMGSLMLEEYGWESLFYSIGALAGLWALVVWLCLLKGVEVPPRQKDPKDPQWSLSRWLSLVKKPPVWAMIFAHMCHSSSSVTLLSWLPTYFKESFPHASGWVYNVVPWAVAIPSALAGGYFSDVLIRQGYGVSLVRKIMQFFAMGVSSMFIILLSGDVSFPSAVTFISAAIGLSNFSSGGVTVNVQDLTPSCAGALYGFMNMMGAFMVFLVFGDARRVDLQDYTPLVQI
ncbi:Solute carrier family 17 member 9 [Dissostichus eleginoides]|uniref:Solute carrier family 17 member 9 n=1 Tax=Dissostichus eleginoides TaxID=100907 RepID=A0AAD9CAN6_DISEL|nr:Solute carrier family 17 member 9 [Dissostichus eleginoides]